jgi:hypothetical protein
MDLLLAHGAPIEAKAKSRNDMYQYQIHEADRLPPWATPLLLARSYASVKLLLEKGANVDARDSYSMTLLHRSLLIGIGQSADVVALLIAKGADVNAVDIYNMTPLHRVTYTGNVTMVEFFLTNAPNATSTNLYNLKSILAVSGKVGSGSRLEALIDGLKNTNDGTRGVDKCKIVYHFFKHWFFGITFVFFLRINILIFLGIVLPPILFIGLVANIIAVHI